MTISSRVYAELRRIGPCTRNQLELAMPDLSEDQIWGAIRTLARHGKANQFRAGERGRNKAQTIWQAVEAVEAVKAKTQASRIIPRLHIPAVASVWDLGLGLGVAVSQARGRVYAPLGEWNSPEVEA